MPAAISVKQAQAGAASAAEAGRSGELRGAQRSLAKSPKLV